MALLDDINRVWRDFVRYTGDGLPGAPAGRPLPNGDPASGQHYPGKDEIRDLLISMLQATGDPTALQTLISSVNAASTRTLLPFSAAATGTGAAYSITVTSIPINGQTFHWTPHIDSTVDNPTLTITDGTTTVTRTLYAADSGPVRLRGGAPYITRQGAGVNYVLTQQAFSERRVSDFAPIRAASAVAVPSTYGSLQPLPVSGPTPYQIQPFHTRASFLMQGPAGVLDCSNMIPGTLAEVYVRSGDKIVAGAGRSFLGRAGGTATGTGNAIVRVIAFYTHIALEEVSGAAPTYAASEPLTYDTTIAVGGQSNANLFALSGGIGGFSWGLRNWLQTPIHKSVRWVNGATGGSALDRRSVSAESDLYWWDNATDLPGPALTTFTAALDAAVADGAPPPAWVMWSQGEADAGAIQVGLFSTNDMVTTIRAVWGHIRALYPGIRFIVNPLGSHDDRTPDRGANAVRVAYLRAIAAENWAHQGAELYDLQRAEGDIHYFGQSYAVAGARLARIWANITDGQSNRLGPRVTGSTVAPGGRSVTLAVDWGSAAFTPQPSRVNADNPFGIYAIAPGADPVAAPIPLMSVQVADGVIRITSSFDLTGHQIGGPWGYMAEARRGHIIRDLETDPYHLMPGQPLRSFLIQL